MMIRVKSIAVLPLLLVLCAPAAAQSEPQPVAQAEELAGAFYALSTPDADRLSRWWTEHLGFGVLRSGGSPDGRVKFALLRRGQYLVEIVQRSDAQQRRPLKDRSFDHGIFKIGFLATDLDAIERNLRRGGVQFSHGIVRPAGNPLRTFAVQDPDGNVVQIFGD